MRHRKGRDSTDDSIIPWPEFKKYVISDLYEINKSLLELRKDMKKLEKRFLESKRK